MNRIIDKLLLGNSNSFTIEYLVNRSMLLSTSNVYVIETAVPIGTIINQLLVNRGNSSVKSKIKELMKDYFSNLSLVNSPLECVSYPYVYTIKHHTLESLFKACLLDLVKPLGIQELCVFTKDTHKYLFDLLIGKDSLNLIDIMTSNHLSFNDLAKRSYESTVFSEAIYRKYGVLVMVTGDDINSYTLINQRCFESKRLLLLNRNNLQQILDSELVDQIDEFGKLKGVRVAEGRKLC